LGSDGFINRCSKTIYSVMDRITGILHDIFAFATIIFLLLVFFQVFMRYVVNNPIYGVDETVLSLMVWSSAIGLAIVYWNNEHPRLNVLMNRLPRVCRVIMHFVTAAIVLVLGYIFIKGGIFLFHVQQKQMPVGGMPFTKAFYYALPMIVSGVLLIAMTIARMFRYITTGADTILTKTPDEGGVSLD